MTNENFSLHLHLEGHACPCCSHQNQQAENASTVNAHSFTVTDTSALGIQTAEFAQQLTMVRQDLVIPNAAAGYVKSLFGSDAAVWTNGGANSAAFGNAINVTYTFQDVSWGNPYRYANEQAFDAQQVAVARAGMQWFSNLANITFTEVAPGSAQMAFREYDLPAGVAGQAVTWTYNDNGGGADRIAQTEVTMDTTQTGYTAGQYGFMALLHEIGHGLGLKHPGNYNAGGGGANGPYLTDFGLADNHDLSIMSYYAGPNTSSTKPSTPMLYDIAAIQYLYGVNRSYNAGDTRYTIGTAAEVSTRWDGAGNDMLDAGAAGVAVTLDLREGETYITRVGQNISWNAFGANIENASGGSGNDVLNGNALGNVLTGGAGDDTLAGGTGNDTLTGGAGVDVYTIGTADGTETIIDNDGSIRIGSNTISGTATSTGTGTYSLTVGGVNYILTMSGTTLSISGGGSTVVNINNFDSGDFGITLGAGGTGGGGGGGGGTGGTGGALDIFGTPIGDTLNGTAAQERIWGYASNDQIRTNGGADTVYAGDGDDRVTVTGGVIGYGDAGNDILDARGATSGVNLYGGDGNDSLYGTAYVDTFTGGLGNDSLEGGLGRDIYNFGNSDGADRIYDQDAQGDIMFGATRISGDFTGTGGSYSALIGGSTYTLSQISGGYLLTTSSGTTSVTLANFATGNFGINLVESAPPPAPPVVTARTINGTARTDNLNGTAAVELIFGRDGNDFIRTNGGNDTAYGGGGDDRIIVTGTGDVFAYGEGGNDVINATTATGGRFYLDGGARHDTIFGGNAADTIVGGAGTDVLTGNGGADIFLIVSGGERDTITDFTDGVDKIGLNGYSGSVTVRTVLGNAEVTAGSQTFILNGVNGSLIDAADFV